MTILAIDPALAAQSDTLAASLADILRRLDASEQMTGLRILKRESDLASGTLVCVCTLLGRPVVIKRTPLGLGGMVKAAFKASRGWRHWRGAAWLLTQGIPTARPLALLRSGSAEVLIMDALDGPSLLQAMADRSLNIRQQHALADAPGELIARLAHHARYNRDHKPSNLIVTKLTDTHAELAIIDCVAILPISRMRPPVEPLLRMLSSQVIEPLGCGVLPRRALLLRALRACLRAQWQLDARNAEPTPTAAPGSPAAPAKEQREWELASMRLLWREVARIIHDHGDPTPRINPLATS